MPIQKERICLEHLFLPVLLGWLFFRAFWFLVLNYLGLEEPHYPLWACYVIQTINWILIVLNVIVVPVLTVTVFHSFLTSVMLTLAVLAVTTTSLLPSPGGKQSPDHPQKSGK